MASRFLRSRFSFLLLNDFLFSSFFLFFRRDALKKQMTLAPHSKKKPSTFSSLRQQTELRLLLGCRRQQAESLGSRRAYAEVRTSRERIPCRGCRSVPRAARWTLSGLLGVGKLAVSRFVLRSVGQSVPPEVSTPNVATKDYFFKKVIYKFIFVIRNF